MRTCYIVLSVVLCCCMGCENPFEDELLFIPYDGSVEALWIEPADPSPGDTVEIHVTVEPGPYVFIDCPYVDLEVSGGKMFVAMTPIQSEQEGTKVNAPDRTSTTWYLPDEPGLYSLIAEYDGDIKVLFLELE